MTINLHESMTIAKDALRICAKSDTGVELLTVYRDALARHIDVISTRAATPFEKTQFGPPLSFEEYGKFLSALTFIETVRSQCEYQIAIRGDRV